MSSSLRTLLIERGIIRPAPPSNWTSVRPLADYRAMVARRREAPGPTQRAVAILEAAIARGMQERKQRGPRHAHR